VEWSLTDALAICGILKENGSAIRQTVFAIQYGSGFILIALSLILAALVRIIRKP